MEFFRIHRDIPFMRHALVLNVVSFLTFAAAVFFLVSRGLHLSIEFTGGTVMEVGYTQPADIEKTRVAVESLGFGEVQVQNFGTSRDVLIRLPLRGGEKQDAVALRVFGELCRAEGGSVTPKQYTTPQGEQVQRQACVAAGDAEPIRLSRTEFVGPTVGQELALDGALALYHGLLPNVRIERRYAPSLPKASVDPEQMRRVVLNLVDNAAEAMGRAGTIWLSTEHDQGNNLLRIVVADDGPGIPPAERDKLFLPYYSTKQRGSGLGLAIVRRIVAEHGGAIDVAENTPRGTRFVIELPC